MNKSMIKRIAFTTLLAICSYKAMAAERLVLCPNVNLVKQSSMYLDTVTKATPPVYVIWSTVNQIVDAEHNAWSIVTYVSATAMDEALQQGVTTVKNTTENKQKYAVDMQTAYLCGYKSPGSSLGVALILDKDEQTKDFKLMHLNLSLLK